METPCSVPAPGHAVLYFTKLATVSGQQRDDYVGVVECGAIPHLVRLQSSPTYEIRDLAVRALVAGALPGTRYREEYQQAQKARTQLEMLQEQRSKSNDSAEGVSPRGGHGAAPTRRS